MQKYLIIIFILICAPLSAEIMNFSAGAYAGITPAMGGDLDSFNQEYYFNSSNGINGINRSMDNYETENIDRLFGICGGLEVKTIFFEYFLLRIAGNYFQSVYGGNGKTVFTDDNINYYELECKYSFTGYDIPVTAGISVPFWRDVRLSLSCGIAYARAEYKNSFKSETYSDPFEREASFKGWTLPMVIVIQGEFFITNKLALNSTISYYKGYSEVIKDSNESDITGMGGQGTTDYARIDFSGYRYNFGVSYYFYSL